VTVRLPGRVVAVRVNALAVEREETLEEEIDPLQHEEAGAQASDEVR